MKPSKIRIEGDYWDCQMYRGRLYLWTMEGELKVVDWYSLVASIKASKQQHLPLRCAFTDGNYLYNYALKSIFHDPDFKNLLQQKFFSISQNDFIVEESELEKHLIGIQTNPFNELHIDSEISSNRLYVLTENLFKSATAHRNDKKFPVSSKTIDHFSINAFSIKANNYSKFAISAGSDGLFEFDAFMAKEERYRKGDDYLKQIVSVHSSFADYSFLSIYNSSLIGNSGMAYQQWESKEIDFKNPISPHDRNSIKFEKMIPEDEIFKTQKKSKLSWGTNEKLYKATDDGIELVRFANYISPEHEIFSETEIIAIEPINGNIVSARTAYFGSIIEYDNVLVVLLSDQTEFTISGPITRWRIYPRSFNYENHLHVIKENCLEIYSFNNDYFIDQNKKNLGISYKIKAPFTRKRKKALDNLDIKVRVESEDVKINLEDLPF